MLGNVFSTALMDDVGILSTPKKIIIKSYIWLGSYKYNECFFIPGKFDGNIVGVASPNPKNVWLRAEKQALIKT